MLKKLRIKFIALNMATVAVVLVVVFTAICVIDYQQSASNVFETLNSSISRAGDGEGSGGKQAKDFAPGGEGAAEDTGASAPENAATDVTTSDATIDAANATATSDTPANTTPQENHVDATPPQIGGKHGNSPFIPVAVYLYDEGGLSPLATMTSASIADDVLEQAATALANKGDGSGSLNSLGLFYAKRVVGDQAYVAFADMSAASSWQTLALTLTAVGFAALVAFLVISVFFSRWALRPVEQAWSQQQQFVADASHELKTPLTVILANAAILRGHPERSIASQSQWVESTQTEAERMQELVCDMLDLAKPDAARLARVQTRVNLADLVEGDLLQFESVAFERNVTLASDIDPDVFVLGDAARLHRLTSTLLDNACKYANEGGTITVMLHQTTRHVTLTAHNTGTAIDAADLPHVFDRFYRADKARTHDVGGYGLGLAIAREIAEEHNGTIAATSSAAHGTTFAVTLPIYPKGTA